MHGLFTISKDEESAEIARLTEEYLAKGGKITIGPTKSARGVRWIAPQTLHCSRTGEILEQVDDE